MIVPTASVCRSTSVETVETEVAIIGAGPAGLFLGSQLRRKGIRVAVFEAGPLHQSEYFKPSPVVMTGRAHRGVTLGRSEGLGGTSTIWSGGLIPFHVKDLQARPHVGLDAWPIDAADLTKYLADIETFFCVDHDAYECDDLRRRRLQMPAAFQHADFTTRHAKIVPFKARNAAQNLKRAIKDDPGFEVHVDARVTDIRLDQSGERVDDIVVTGPSSQYRVHAKTYVIAAGALETTRLLLALRQSGQSRVLDDCFALGRYFFDHLTMVAAHFQPRDIDAFSRFGAYHFVGAAMRSLRLELSPAAQAEDRVLSCYGYVHYEGGSEFEELRQLMHSVQRAGALSQASAISGLKYSPHLAKLLLWRLYHRRLLWTDNGTFKLRLVSEQVPRPDSRLQLSRETDRYGQNLLSMNWLVSDIDLETLKAFCQRFDRYWNEGAAHHLARLDWDGEPGSAAENAEDFFHPAGSTRMGTDKVRSVVRPDLRLHGINNLYIASTSVFPSGASANPTLTLMLLTSRLAERLGSLVNSTIKVGRLRRAAAHQPHVAN